MSDSPWRLSGGHASLACGPLAASFDSKAPHQGLANLRIHGACVDGWLLGVDVADASTSRGHLPWEPADVFVRNRDLVVAYAGPQGLPYSLQIYWRVVAWPEHEPGGVVQAVIDAIVSVQTRQWAAFPGVVVSSRLPREERSEFQRMEFADAEGLVWTSSAGWNYFETPRPGDFSIGPAEPSTGWPDSHWQFGGQLMERGVIRRLTVRGAFFGGQDQMGPAARLHSALAAEPPPLTA